MSLHARQWLPAVTVAAGTTTLYLYHLNAVGVLGPDEPRYVAIGRAMAQSGDLITPRLWGSPWFEKPPLLYWLTALGTWAGLPQDICGRVPVVLLSLCFLLASFYLLRREFGETAASLSTAALATSAGWLAFSGLALTDIPLAVCFSTAVWIALPLVGSTPNCVRVRFAAMGLAIGLGALAKGLVPIALAIPFLWFLRRYWRDWWIAIATGLVIALPWYLAVYAGNGWPFIEEFFIRHHVQRLYSSALQHVQPWWYYIPVLLLGLFPWTPLLFTMIRRKGWDERQKFLLSIVVFGFLLFSISLNKLPGYLLPLIPPLLALACSRFEIVPKNWLAPCAVLMMFIPLVAAFLPASLEGSHGEPFNAHIGKTTAFFMLLPFAAWLLGRRSWLPEILLLCVVASGMLVKTRVASALDRAVSARVLWQETVKPVASQVCDGGMNRDWIYGLSFYANREIRPCWQASTKYWLRGQGRSAPVLVVH